MAALDPWQVRFKVFDYGVMSVALTRPIPGTWRALLAEGLRWHDDPALTTGAERLCRELVDRLRPALTKPRADLLSEDYLVFAATRLDEPGTADALLAARGRDIAQLLRGESEPLSAQERDDVLRHHISYLATDPLEHPGWAQRWRGRRFTRAARQVHSLFIDVNELTDKTENALKIAGDVYAARLFNLVATRLGLEEWKGNVREKLKTLDDIYRFAVEQTAMARGELLELAIVLILILELVLFFAGIMR